ncbi:restriction endonuclease subunit S [Candidatus Pelagibacter sp.]|uniref:restriction endonuclease subunit S n=1 Tax=Candidatus Pelagibacter sp. TaxID=2024849 RepID=UPI003F86FF97
MTWKTKTLSELCKMYQPKTLTKKQLKPGGKYLVYGANGVIGKYDRYNHEESQLLITCRGATCGSINISEPFSWINGNAMIIQPNESEISKKFLEYLFMGPINVSKIITGSAQPQITRESLNPVLVSYPSLTQQQHIVAKLDAAFFEIDKAIKLSEQNQRISQKLFGIVVYRKLKSLGTKSNKRFENLCSFVRGPFGGSLKKSIFVKNGYAVYEQQHPINNQFKDFRYFITKEKFIEMSRFAVKPNDLLMSCSGVTLGKVGIVTEEAPEGIINQALLKITPNKNLLPKYLQLLIRSKIFQDLIWKVSGGAAQPNVPSIKVIKNLSLPFPSLSEQIEIVKWSEKLENFTSTIKSSDKTQKLKDLKSVMLLKELQPIQEKVA